jgi:predicted nuclease of predicted toxin-antitoxin system
MKLLFDQNLSPRLMQKLDDLFPDSTHVALQGLDRAEDRIVWNFARQQDLVLVSKDSDFSELNLLLGFPPKVIWICRGNCSTSDIEQILRQNYDLIQTLEQDESVGILLLR